MKVVGGLGLLLGRRRYKEGNGTPKHDRRRSSALEQSCRMSLEQGNSCICNIWGWRTRAILESSKDHSAAIFHHIPNGIPLEASYGLGNAILTTLSRENKGNVSYMLEV